MAQPRVTPGIELVRGPMFSGKSTELLRLAERHELAQRTVAVITSTRDTRYTTDGSLSSHSKQTRKSDAVVDKLADARTNGAVMQADVILIDEGQFYADLVEEVSTLVDVHKKLVIVAALSGTFEQKPFDNVADLDAMADKTYNLRAVCTRCGADAPFTIRIASESKEVEVVGGKELYAARCRACLKEP